MKLRRLVQTQVQLHPPALADQRQHLEGLTFEKKIKKGGWEESRRERGSEGLAIMRAVYSLSTSAGRSNGVGAERPTDGPTQTERGGVTEGETAALFFNLARPDKATAFRVFIGRLGAGASPGTAECRVAR